jgi:hypothetical protein
MSFFDWFGGKQTDHKYDKPIRHDEAGKEDDSLGLGEVVRGIQHVVNSATELVSQHFTEQLERYFTEDGQAITKRIILPDNKSAMDVPLVALVPPSGLRLDKAKISLAVRVERVKVKKRQLEGSQTPHDRASFRVNIANPDEKAPKGAGLINFEMEFSAGDPPEASMRIVEAFCNGIVPKKIDDPTT